MYIADKEKKIIESFIKYLSNDIFTKEKFLLVWKNGTKISATFDTTDEDDNGLEPDDPDYEEYTSFIMKIQKIICLNEKDGFNWVADRELFEFSYKDFPDEIYNSKGELISKREN